MTTTALGTIQLASFINPAGLEARGENLFIETMSSGSPIISEPDINGMGYLAQRYIETSNVNVVEEMANMIQTQRAYDINSRAVTVSDQMLQRLANLGT
jgi:flagellar basal-body rod protein FlgG